MKLNYLIIPLIAASFAAVSGYFASAGLPGVDIGVSWYENLQMPSWTPPGYVFSIVWTTILVLTTISLIIVWNKESLRLETSRFRKIIFLFVANGVLYASWTLVFFALHLAATSVFVAGLLAADVFALIFIVYHFSRLAALLLLPYALWSSFATYLTYAIWKLN